MKKKESYNKLRKMAYINSVQPDHPALNQPITPFAYSGEDSEHIKTNVMPNKLKSLAKGLKGDWQKEGYRLEHSVGKDNGIPFHDITSYDKDGQEAGYASFQHATDNSLSVAVSQVHPEHQRKGLGTAMYQLAEQKSGRKVINRPQLQSNKAKKLWSQLNRPFGKSELIKAFKGTPKGSPQPLETGGTGSGTGSIGKVSAPAPVSQGHGIKSSGGGYSQSSFAGKGSPTVTIKPGEANTINYGKIEMDESNPKNKYFRNKLSKVNKKALEKDDANPSGTMGAGTKRLNRDTPGGAADRAIVSAGQAVAGAAGSAWGAMKAFATGTNTLGSTVSSQVKEATGKSELIELEELTKRSKNVREQTRNITTEQAKQRRLQYASSIGLNTQETAIHVTTPSNNILSGNTIGYNNFYGPEHETAHAMMTPKGKTIKEYLRSLTPFVVTPQFIATPQTVGNREVYQSAVDESVANATESMIDRRAGVGGNASRYRSRFQLESLIGEKIIPEGGGSDEDNYHDKYHDEFPVPHEIPLPLGSETQRNLKPFKAKAAEAIEQFDEGAKFTPEGTIKQPTGIDAKINARSKLRSRKRNV